MSTAASLKQYAYYRTGGTAEAIFFPHTVEQLQEVMQEINQKKWPYFVLGGGTNSLVMDQPWPGAVILCSHLNRIEYNGRTVSAGAGVDNSFFAEYCFQQGLTGAGWMNGLPGQIGGTTRMNARCYGGEISQIVHSVTTVTASGSLRTYLVDEKIFRGYKDTVFMGNKEIIAEVCFSLNPGDRFETRALMDQCKMDREAKGQYMHPSCGCVFKNDYAVGVPSGKLLDMAGVRKLALPRAVEISPFHANFVFNKGASSLDIIEATLRMREKVYEYCGVWLTYEMEILGEIPPEIKTRLLEQRPQQVKQDVISVLKNASVG